ncbi:hypothetical protein C8E89_104221 [Mycolicibacterium moriokaense]|uniref:Uncharacterized protein n=1 Tax=Mycolicibacterium moriokaense TaxID=39691 RepID=A0A318HJK4_9MYCO|nr:hypothetical protein C8E89_104221 [Mycolicibacterium moriokaense]
MPLPFFSADATAFAYSENVDASRLARPNISAAASWERPDHALISGMRWHVLSIPVTARDTVAAPELIASADAASESGFQPFRAGREGSIGYNRPSNWLASASSVTSNRSPAPRTAVPIFVTFCASWSAT